MMFRQLKSLILIILVTSLFFSCDNGIELDTNRPLRPENPLMLWDFPLPRTHTGVLLGNGTQGLMVWGHDSVINITVGRAGFWDHRAGKDFLVSTSYDKVKALLQKGAYEELEEVFGMGIQPPEGMPGRPFQIGGGRLEVTMPAGWKLDKAILNTLNGHLEIIIYNETTGESRVVKARQSMANDVAGVVFPPALADQFKVKLVPSYAHVGEELKRIGIDAPVEWNNTNNDTTFLGFVQKLPDDPPLVIEVERVKWGALIGSALGYDAKQKVANKLDNFDYENELEASTKFWINYWNSVPEINLPDPVLQDVVKYGLYKQAICTPPHGIACSLQGTFNEEYRIPPWSNDYHFNINIEMIYLPALATNRAKHFMPLWEMIKTWMPQLKQNGETFFGREGALMLPHAVDDQGKVVGTFWTGTIDHACTAWMAQLAWQHYRYTKDEKILKEIAWPLLTGAFEGYWAMTEQQKHEDGRMVYSLPITVSPEYNGSGRNAWGRDASFQLAAYHMIADIMPEAAKVMNVENDNRWENVQNYLPEYCSTEGKGWNQPRIALWEGQDLANSHRHHSHLAGIYPFGTIDPTDEQFRLVVNNSYKHWIQTGAGSWSGWGIPWASILHNRMNEPEAAVSWLHYWRRNFVNEGRGTLHNAAFGGISSISSPGWHNIPEIEKNDEIMQLDAGFGALSAILDLLVHERDGVVHVLPKIHRDWKKFDFKGIAVPGGFLVGASVEKRQIKEVTVTAQLDGTLKLANPFGGEVKVGEQSMSGEVLEIEMKAGEQVVLVRG